MPVGPDTTPEILAVRNRILSVEGFATPFVTTTVTDSDVPWFALTPYGGVAVIKYVPSIGRSIA